MISTNDMARSLCVHALTLDLENDNGFHTFVEKMEKIADLLNLEITL